MNADFRVVLDACVLSNFGLKAGSNKSLDDGHRGTGYAELSPGMPNCCELYCHRIFGRMGIP